MRQPHRPQPGLQLGDRNRPAALGQPAVTHPPLEEGPGSAQGGVDLPGGGHVAFIRLPGVVEDGAVGGGLEHGQGRGGHERLEAVVEVEVEPVGLVGVAHHDPVTHPLLHLEQMLPRLGVLDPAHGG